MKKGFIILIIFILVCIAGGSFLAIHLIRNIEVNETAIVKEPLNHEGIENFTSVNLDLTSMDVKIEKSSENAISYRLQDVKKQKLDYSVDDGVLTVKEIISDKHFIGHDDNEVIIDLYERTIENISDAEVVAVAKNGEEAIEILENNVENIDLIILDIVMPKKDGIDVLKFMKDNNISKKVIVITSCNSEITIRSVTELGANYYILKPRAGQ